MTRRSSSPATATSGPLPPTARHRVAVGQATADRAAVPGMSLRSLPLGNVPVSGLSGAAAPSLAAEPASPGEPLNGTIDDGLGCAAPQVVDAHLEARLNQVEGQVFAECPESDETVAHIQFL